MVGLTSRSIYGIVVVLELAKNYGKRLLKIDDIARTKKIPRSYLVQILNRLKHFNLIESIRGNKGGYRLIDKPSKITLFQVVEKLEDGFNVFDGYKKNDAVKNFFKRAMEELKESLNVSLNDILLEQERLEKKVMYFI